MDNINEFRRLLFCLVAGLAIMLCSFLLSSCADVRYIPVETVRTDSIYNTIYRHDSIHVRDSIYILDKGDTVYQYRYRYMFVDKMKHDTLYIERIDSVRVPYPVEKKLTRWQSLKQETGGYAIVSVFVAILIVFGRFIYKIKREG